ncbi:Precorrin-4 C11-methyltransferase [Pseudomonas syringae pv. aptata]|uniref:Precorrin-4 C11-methyltransferase n=1 Tax=Pseudomonas syringae pv. aptata TaxID=83167 RepID=A0A3M3WFH5_PSEAP|nr:Precorrin-4 C11-methyltransferase [Pseudomonas syringae]RMO56526.1 Precorrin-4 C11-methyltransferase [Pseudomonas syringae pv. aptata]
MLQRRATGGVGTAPHSPFCAGVPEHGLSWRRRGLGPGTGGATGRRYGHPADRTAEKRAGHFCLGNQPCAQRIISPRSFTPENSLTVYFIGAGPGDPELITVKGQRLIRSCPVIIYAGSLVPLAVLEGHQAVQVTNSAELHLEQIIELIKRAHAQGQDVARVHSGDPSLYGAIGEQIRHLRELGIPFEIIPGVTATAACAALLGVELTLPDVSQSVILTRYADKTSMPNGEELASLASHRATMAIHLGVNNLQRIVEELMPHYGADCPIAVVHRASWPDQDWAVGTLADIHEKVQAKGFRRTALILVGRVLADDTFSESSLYRAGHAHLFRPV